MRGLLFAAGLLLAGAMAWLLLAGGPGETPIEVEAPPPARQEPGDPARGESRSLLPGRTQPPTHAAAPAGSPGKQKDLSRHTNLHLSVHDRISGQALSAFRCVLHGPEGERSDRHIQGAELDLRLVTDIGYELRVEAKGFEPANRRVRLGAGEPMRRLRIELTPVAPSSGIELLARGPDQAPITRVEVLAWRLAEDKVPARLLWRRRAENETGLFVLPQLEPGRYRFDVAPLTAEGQRTTLQTARHTMTFAGAERVRVPLTFARGALITLQVQDEAGRPLGTEVLLRILESDHTAMPLAWIGTQDGEPVRRLDGLPAKGPAVLAEPLPPGAYRLQLRRGKGPVTERLLALEAGQRLELKIILP